ncbi:hypothetical protein JW898_06025 [Candidatus Woesearchaeota archaeon]|nr:hypothetical protein [Candidatus Woesearchaeota archaeon]
MALITECGRKSGLYLVAESIDCGGKGSIVSAIKRAEMAAGKRIIDLRLLWPSNEERRIADGGDNPLSAIYGTNDVIPEYGKLKSFFVGEDGKRIDVIFTCEPTWARTGLKIRNKLIHEVKGLDYTARDAAEAYAEDRQELISKLIRPAILDGVDVYCERNFCSSVVYQSSMDNPLTVDHILALEGNRYAAGNAPHLYVICDVSAETAMERKSARDKKDCCKFETLEFQRRIEGKYRAGWLRELLESQGSCVAYVNTEKPKRPEDTVRAALAVVGLFRSGKLKGGQKFNYGIRQ